MRFLLAFIFAVFLPGGVLAQDTEFTLGYLSQEGDPRYATDFSYARIELFPHGDAIDGAKLAIQDMKIVSKARGFSVTLMDAAASDDAGLAAAARKMAKAGAEFVVLDLPAARVDALADAVADTSLTLVNATSRAVSLRRACHDNLLHTAASDRMFADSLTQFLRRQDWTDVLMLVGKRPRDQQRAAAFQKSAKRLGLHIVDRRPFDLSNNPERRDENNVRLLTADTGDYNIVYLADTNGEFGRYVPYQTNLPRPVIGTTGLVPREWHWSSERYGAPQVNSRFQDLAGGRRMLSRDWSTWIATRAIITAYAKAPEMTPESVRNFLESDDFRVDGSKGLPQSFRPWSGQMRMPIMLTTSDAVVDFAPLEGFLHETDTLDTLGIDEPGFSCG